MPASEAYADAPLAIVENDELLREESSQETSEEWAASGDAPIIAVPQDDLPEETSSSEPTAEHSAEPALDQDVETLADADEDAESRKRFRFLRRYRIQEVIKRGQIVLVQVLKEERGNKGASLTTYISLAGRYCVLMPNTLRSGGVSRKIANAEDRRRLKQVAERFDLPKGMSIIIRTAGSDREPEEIYRDYEYLIRLWDKIREDTLASTAPALVHEEGDLIKRSIRDLYQSAVEEILVEGETAFLSARGFMETLMPNHVGKVKQYQSQIPLFHAYDVEDQLIGMTDPVVTLHSGAYIVINPTEALVSIDVNSGRATGERNIEETATKANIAAAHEIARQLRLRDLAGLIVIDFIDMNEQRNRRAVERTLKDALKQDRARIQLSRISAFGLLEMSRQRLRPSISELNMVSCPHCEGSGLVRSTESMALHILRAIEKEASASRRDQIVVTTTSRVASYMLNLKRESLEAVEERYDVRVFIEIDDRVAHPGFRIETSHSSDGGYILAEEKKFAKLTEQDDSRGRRRRGRGRRGGEDRHRGEDRNRNDERGGREDRRQQRSEPEMVESAGDYPGNEPVDTFGETQPRREGRGRRNRRGRGGRRNQQQDSLPATGAPEGEDFAHMIEDMPLPVSVEGAGDASGFAESESGTGASGEERQGRRRGRRGG
ncbi:MAG: ribonuclease E/G, partial [Alphaproteobacteria bacterium]|nr:ribonuclease E/G [Alphaproteobacteria bacterium]